VVEAGALYQLNSFRRRFRDRHEGDTKVGWHHRSWFESGGSVGRRSIESRCHSELWLKECPKWDDHTANLANSSDSLPLLDGGSLPWTEPPPPPFVSIMIVCLRNCGPRVPRSGLV